MSSYFGGNRLSIYLDRSAVWQLLTNRANFITSDLDQEQESGKQWIFSSPNNRHWQ
jgi:hypothetical protein